MYGIRENSKHWKGGNRISNYGYKMMMMILKTNLEKVIDIILSIDS